MPCPSTNCASMHDGLEIGDPECVRMVVYHELCFSSRRSDPDSEKPTQGFSLGRLTRGDSGELEAISEPPVMVLVAKAKPS
jgi:hypothetical protein